MALQKNKKAAVKGGGGFAGGEEFLEKIVSIVAFGIPIWWHLHALGGGGWVRGCVEIIKI